MHVGKWTERRSLLTPGKIALKDIKTDRSFTYMEIHNRATNLAAILQKKYQITRGDRLAILAKNRIEMVDIYFAAAKLGAIFVPLNFRLSVRELEKMVNDCQPRMLFYEQAFKEKIHGVLTGNAATFGVTLDSSTQEATDYQRLLVEAEGYCFSSPMVSPEDPLMILYTGGTTGDAKGALLSHRMVFWNAINTIVSWGLQQEDIAPIFTPLFHTGGWNVLLMPLFHMGATSLLFDSFDPQNALEVFNKERCTIGFMVPTMYQMLLEQPAFGKQAFLHVRFFISGGAPCPMNIFEAFWEQDLVFKQGYGLTEVGPNCFSLASSDVFTKSPSVGKPVFYSDVRIIDEKRIDVEQGKIGELVLKGPHVCSGYYKNKEATLNALFEGYFLTGDLARQDEDGFYYIVDRRKHMIISGGENIYPTEIEEVLHRHPSILDAAVVGQPDEKWGETVKAVIVVKKGESISPQDIIQFAKQFLGGYKVPKVVEFRSELPKNAAGKILKREL
jgi:fatty-acyl-CoA synthase